MRGWWALTCLFAVTACSAADSPRLSQSKISDTGLLGEAGSGFLGARPAIQNLPPISRNPGATEQTEHVEMGTGRYIKVDERKQVETTDGGRTVTLNFVDVEIQEFARVVFDEILRETVIIDSSLKGRITLRTPTPISKNAVLDLVRQALQTNGASLVRSGGAYRVAARADERNGNRRLGESVRIVPVQFISPDEAKAALASFSQGGVEITANTGGRYVVISGPPSDLDNLEQVIGTLDVDQMRGMSVSLLPLREAGAAPVANELNQVFGRGNANDQRAFRALPITRMNAILIVSPQPNVMTEARKWVTRLDRADQDGRRIYVYPVQNRRAPEIAKILAGILGAGKTSTNEPPVSAVAPQLTPASGFTRSPQTIPATAPLAPDNTDITSLINADKKPQGPRVDADASTNSVVVIANTDEWRVIESALRRLDVMAPQVMIEATIAEVRLNDALRHGVRWYFEKGNHAVALTGGGPKPFSSLDTGFSYAFGVPHARLVVNALEEVTDVEVVSSPALTVLDNQTAKLQVGDQVPIATRAARSVLEPNAPLVNDIELKDTGVILSVTPHVNASGLVILDITQEVSDVVPTTTSNLDSPTIRQRKVSTAVSVRSGQEIVLGGLISTGRTKTASGVPFLMQIPLIGNAFKSNAVQEGGRTELVVILRPIVMGKDLDIANVTREIKSRLSVGRRNY